MVLLRGLRAVLRSVAVAQLVSVEIPVTLFWRKMTKVHPVWLAITFIAIPSKIIIMTIFLENRLYLGVLRLYLDFTFNMVKSK